MSRTAQLSRRALVQGAAGIALASLLPRPGWASTELALAAGPAKVRLGGPQSPEVAVWAYGGSVPGPQLRVRQGERVSITVFAVE